MKLLSLFEPPNRLPQAEDMDLFTAVTLVNSASDCVKTLRTENEFSALWDLCAPPASATEAVPCYDAVQGEMNARFGERSSELIGALAALNPEAEDNFLDPSKEGLERGQRCLHSKYRTGLVTMGVYLIRPATPGAAKLLVISAVSAYNLFCAEVLKGKDECGGKGWFPYRSFEEGTIVIRCLGHELTIKRPSSFGKKQLEDILAKPPQEVARATRAPVDLQPPQEVARASRAPVDLQCPSDVVRNSLASADLLGPPEPLLHPHLISRKSLQLESGVSLRAICLS
ncbi:hypothetical protein J4Q44_G00091160 [Coregonus suidteri]|uniref:Uncharacterized protein n=1 Tax=Coregonus suidteri TaxID=861788 RepID=A0AAN8M0V9_9TELE